MFSSALLNQIETESIHGKVEEGEDLRLVTDTRSIENEEVYLAIKGVQFDGADYMENALDKGCRYVIYENSPTNRKRVAALALRFTMATFVGVKDTILALQDLASKNRIQWGGVVIGITGSNGKTTTKEITRVLLDKIFPEQILSTKGNYNNHIGVPLTLLRLNKLHKFAVIEMGTNHPGEIERLCQIALPDAGILTNIGESHLEFLKSREGIFEEKSSLYRAVSENSLHDQKIFVINRDDNYLEKLDKLPNVVSIGKEKGDVRFTVENNGQIKVSTDVNMYSFKNDHLFGEHNIYNLVSALALVEKLCPYKTQELAAILPLVRLPANNRSTWIEKSNLKIFSDAYNANPSSMKASLNAFNEYIINNKINHEKCFLVLGDMNELGINSEQFHMEIGQLLNGLNFLKVAFIGRFSHSYQKGFNEGLVFPTTSDFLGFWEQAKKSYDYLYLKGSRALQLESIIDIT